jgi:hypothetical protein
LTVPIDVTQVKKLPYLGGFRNKKTKVGLCRLNQVDP